MASLQGKRALVTGAGLGIGQGIAIALARQGASVAVHYGHSVEGAHDTLEQVLHFGGHGCVIQGDLSSVSECRRVVEEAIDGLDGLDILVNNAGVTLQKSILETDERTFNDVINLNVRGYYFCAQRAIRHMVEHSSGCILNIASVHAKAGRAGNSLYAASKGAIVSFTQTLAIELAESGIRANAIAPGVIEVPRYDEIPDYSAGATGTRIPVGRVGTPADVGEAAAFLVSDAASFITGQVLFVDGGTTTKMALTWPHEDKDA